jgi:hypothetical protein
MRTSIKGSLKLALMGSAMVFAVVCAVTPGEARGGGGGGHGGGGAIMGGMDGMATSSPAVHTRSTPTPFIARMSRTDIK